MLEDDRDYIEKARRMEELMRPIQQQLLMCDDVRDQLMMACAMVTTAKDIFDLHLGKEGAKRMFSDYAK